MSEITVQSSDPAEALEAMGAPSPAAPSPEVTPADSAPAPIPEAAASPEVTPAESASAPVDDSPEDEDDPEPRTPNVQRRFDRLTRQREQARRDAVEFRTRADMLERQLAELRQAPAAPPWAEPEPPPTRSVPQGVPQQADYATDAEWYQALSRHEAQQAVEAFKAEQMAQRQQQAAFEREQALAAREQAFQQAHPDYVQVVRQNLGGRLTPVMLEVLQTWEHGPQLAYHLAKNPHLLEQMGPLTPHYEVVRHLARLEAEVVRPVHGSSRPPITPKPEPIPTLNGGGSPPVRQLTDMSDAELEAMSQDEYRRLYALQFPKRKG